MTTPTTMPFSRAETRPTRVDGAEVVGALSPSRAVDFVTCPLRYRLRTVDRLPEEPTLGAARGTLVHKVLEDLFDDPAPERTPQRARDLLAPSWEAILAEEPALAGLFGGDGPEVATWLTSCATVLDRWFTLEDPRRLEPAGRELYVETVLDSRLLLRGFVDRLDVARNGAMRVVDYKTGRSPGPAYEARALFQMRFYALVLWRTHGVVPAQLQLVYLGNGEVLRYHPDVGDLLATERKIEAVWHAIVAARESGEWLPRPGPSCSWCSFTQLCPAFGGTPPPVPDPPPPAGISARH